MPTTSAGISSIFFPSFKYLRAILTVFSPIPLSSIASVAKHPDATVVAEAQYVGIFFSLQISANVETPS